MGQEIYSLLRNTCGGGPVAVGWTGVPLLHSLPLVFHQKVVALICLYTVQWWLPDEQLTLHYAPVCISYCREAGLIGEVIEAMTLSALTYFSPCVTGVTRGLFWVLSSCVLTREDFKQDTKQK